LGWKWADVASSGFSARTKSNDGIDKDVVEMKPRERVTTILDHSEADRAPVMMRGTTSSSVQCSAALGSRLFFS
jgi:hypothetical protein